MVGEPSGPSAGASTPGQESTRRSITRTTVTGAPGSSPEPVPDSVRRRRGVASGEHGQLTAAREPYAGTNVLRVVMTSLLSVACLLTIGGAILMLLLWQQNRDAGVLTSQIDRTWDLFDKLRQIERVVAALVVPVAVAWIALATVNVRRATSQRPNPIVAALSLPIGLGLAWFAGSQLVDGADDRITKGAGIVAQIACLAIPMVALERVAAAAESRQRPIRATWVVGAVFLANMEGLGGLSTIDATSDSTKWGHLGAYLLIGGLVEVLGTLSANEAGRAIEEGTAHRYQLRHRFGEALIEQARRQRSS
jgi:hypothetical protein